MATLGSVAGSHLSRVSTCRQTVEVFPSAVHRLGAGGYGLRVGGSHLSPDGGGFSLTLSTAWERVATGQRVATGCVLVVATCRQTVEVFPWRCPPLGSGWLRSCVLVVATCRQTVEVFPDVVHRLGAGGYGLRVATGCVLVVGVGKSG